VLTEAEGLPLVVKTTPANLHDSRMALDLVVSMPPIWLTQSHCLGDLRSTSRIGKLAHPSAAG